MKIKAQFAGMEKVIDESFLKTDDGVIAGIDFDGNMMVAFCNVGNGKFIPVDAINGYGDNCFDDVKDEELTLKKLD